MLPHTETLTLTPHHWRLQELELLSTSNQTNENIGVFVALMYVTLAQAWIITDVSSDSSLKQELNAMLIPSNSSHNKFHSHKSTTKYSYVKPYQTLFPYYTHQKSMIPSLTYGNTTLNAFIEIATILQRVAPPQFPKNMPHMLNDTSEPRMAPTVATTMPLILP